jgi:hypothetical protein
MSCESNQKQRYDFRTRNYLVNLTSIAYTKNPIFTSRYHTFVVLDHNGECVDEFDTWQDAQQCYINQSPVEFVGAWLLYGVTQVTLN